MSAIQSSLSRFIPSQTSSEELEAVKRDGWRKQGILVVSKADPRLSWPEVEMVNQLGESLYGPSSAKV